MQPASYQICHKYIHCYELLKCLGETVNGLHSKLCLLLVLLHILYSSFNTILEALQSSLHKQVLAVVSWRHWVCVCPTGVVLNSNKKRGLTQFWGYSNTSSAVSAHLDFKKQSYKAKQIFLDCVIRSNTVEERRFRRDQSFRFSNSTAPQICVSDCSLAVSLTARTWKKARGTLGGLKKSSRLLTINRANLWGKADYSTESLW